jgi:hypothetical protein
MSRGLPVGHMGAVVVHCMGEFAWREPKTGPTPHHRGFLHRMAKGDRRRHAFERVLVPMLERLKKTGVALRLGLRLVDSTRAAGACRLGSHVALCHSTDTDPQVGNDNFTDDDESRPRCAAGRMALDGTFAFRGRDARAA